MLAVILRPCFSPDDRIIERSDIKRLALSPSSFHNNRTDGVIKEPTLLLSKRAGDVNPGSVVCLSLTGGGGGGGGGDCHRPQLPPPPPPPPPPAETGTGPKYLASHCLGDHLKNWRI